MFETMLIGTLVVSGLVAISVFSTVISFRVGAPLLLVFLGIGLLAGEDGIGGIAFADTHAAYLIGNTALAMALFDSGFHTPFSVFRVAAWPALTLATLGVALTAAMVAVPAHFLLGFDWREGMLLGSIVGSTDAAAVFFLLRVGGITVRERVRSILEVESGCNDPMAIFLVLSLVTFLADRSTHVGFGLRMVVEFVTQFGIGGAAGLAGGWLIVQAVNRLPVERGLLPIAALALALVLFAATSLAGGSGFLAVYIAGLVAGNSRLTAPATLRRFQDGITWLAQIAMFVTLGLFVSPHEFLDVLPAAIGIALTLMLVARPLAVWLCLMPFRTNRNESAFISWVGLRGAVSVLMALLPLLGGLDEARTYLNVTFLVVVISLAVQGWTIGPMARWLGQIVPPRTGPVERQELELPGARHELVAYRIAPDSMVSAGHRLPRWAMPSLVVRDGQSMPPHRAGPPRAADMVYLFADPRQLGHLDRLFASPAPAAEADRQFFGDFALDPAARLGELRAMYGLTVPDGDDDLTIAAFLERYLGTVPGVGDRVPLGEVELIVRAMSTDGTHITEVGLAVEPTPIDKPRRQLFLPSGSELKARLRQMLRPRSS